jgi:polyphenol oxidase
MQPNRRDVIGSAGLAIGALALSGIPIPSVVRADDHPAAHNAKATPFQFGKEPARVRKSFYDLSEQEVRLLCDAVGYMRDGWRNGGKPLSINCPLQWDNYVSTHAHHCTEAGNDVLQVHWSWFFLPWHRAYLFFLERQLANVISTIFGKSADGAKFALPYWDWITHKAMPNTKIRQGMKIPSPLFGFDLETPFDPAGAGDPDPFNLALFDGYRGPTVDNSEMNPGKEHLDGWKNYTRKIRDYDTSPEQIATMLAMPFCIFGGMQHIDRKTGQGLLESSPHNTIHDWVGSRYGNNRDMGTLRYAALDPVFYLHHANIDRIWSLYPFTPDPDKAPTPPNNCEYTEKALKDWGDQRFDFIDTDGKPVYVTVRDTIKNMKNVTYAPSTVDSEPLKAAAKRDKMPEGRTVVISQKETKLTDKPAAFTPKVESLVLPNKADVRAGKPVAAVIEIECGEFYYSHRFQISVYANEGEAVPKPALDDDHFVGSFQVLDSFAGANRRKPDEKHIFFVNVSQGASNFFKIAPSGKAFTLTLVPSGSSSKDQKFFLNVSKITLKVYE